jgi:CubicO group peptidase (beta-lactamase class C family)
MRAADFERIVDEVQRAFTVPSLAVAFSQGNTTYYHTVGHSSTLGGRVTPDTIYPVASISKSFIATCIMMLVEEGSLDLDRPVVQYLPDLLLYNQTLTEQLTIRDMLSHRSGLPRHDAMLSTCEGLGLDEIVRRMRWLEPCWELRERFHYQNHMYGLASLLVERVSGRPWGTFMRKRLFTPLGMTRVHSSWRSFMNMGRDRVRSLATFDGVSRPIHTVSPDNAGSAGALSMSVRDLLRWGQANLAPYLIRSSATGTVLGTRAAHTSTTDGTPDTPNAIPNIIPTRIAAELHRGQTPIRPGEFASYDIPFVDEFSYGFGWFVERYRNTTLIQHGGSLTGFKSIVGFLPEQDCVIAVLANQGASPAPMTLLRILADEALGAERYDWCGFFRSLSADLRGKSKAQYHAAFAQEGAQQNGTNNAGGADSENNTDSTSGAVSTDSRARASLPDACAGVYAHPAYGEVRISTGSTGASLWAGKQRFRLRPGSMTEWAIDTGLLELAMPCFFEYVSTTGADAADTDQPGAGSASGRGAGDTSSNQDASTSHPTAFCAFLEPEIKKPIRFERQSSVQSPVQDSAQQGPAGGSP